MDFCKFNIKYSSKEKKLRFSIDSREFCKCSRNKKFYIIKISGGKIEFIFCNEGKEINFLSYFEAVSDTRNIFKNNSTDLNNQISLGRNSTVILNNGKEFTGDILFIGDIDFLEDRIIYKIKSCKEI